MFLNFFLFHWRQVSIALAFPVISGVWHFWMPVFVVEAEVMRCCVPCPLSPALLLPSAASSLAAGGAIPFWIDVTFVLKSCCLGFFFLLLIFSFASFNGSSEWISGVTSGHWFVHLLVHQELSGTLHPWISLSSWTKNMGRFLFFDSCLALSPSILSVPTLPKLPSCLQNLETALMLCL